MEDKNLQTRPQNCWTNTEIQELVKVLTILIDGQKPYGKEYSLKATLDYFMLKLEKKYGVDQVLFALDKYTDKKNDIPAPSDIINILNPEPPKITTAQYVSAQKWQERNQDWSEFTDAAETIVNYKKQENQAQENFQIECTKIAQIVEKSVKRIT